MKEEKKVSLRAQVAIKTIKFVMNLPYSGVDTVLETGSKLTHLKLKWHIPKGYNLKKLDLDGLPVEVLEAKNGSRDKVILQLHGGGYVIGLLDIYRSIALTYSKISQGAQIVTIDYRTAPKHVYPAALIDAEKAWNWLIESGYKASNIIVVGDSAGGNLAVSLIAKLRDEGKELPKALICMSPWLDLTAKGASYQYNYELDPIFGKKRNSKSTDSVDLDEMYLLELYPADHDVKDPYLSPIFGEFHNFPPMLIQVGTHEVLESDSITVYQKAKAANVDVKLTRYEGMFHVFQLTHQLIPEGKVAWKEVEDFINLHLY